MRQYIPRKIVCMFTKAIFLVSFNAILIHFQKGHTDIANLLFKFKISFLCFHFILKRSYVLFIINTNLNSAVDREIISLSLYIVLFSKIYSTLL